jgi:quinol monooxygenase YgiN
MTTTPLIIIAHFKAKPGQEAQLREELHRLLAPTREEAGCILYDLHESPADPSQFLFYEIWKSQADLDAHLQTPHLQGLLKVAPEIVNGEIELTKWTKV